MRNGLVGRVAGVWITGTPDHRHYLGMTKGRLRGVPFFLRSSGGASNIDALNKTEV